MKAGGLFLCVAALAGAETFQIWEALDVPAIERGRLRSVIHTQFRTRPNLHHYYQARIGPIVRFDLSSHATLIGGYYFGEVEMQPHWGNNHRLFTGLETPFAWKGQTLSFRTMVERHFGGPDAAEIRTREQIQLVRPIRGSVSGILSAETFFDQKGFFQQRTVAGVRVPFVGRYRLDLTYIYDARVDRAGAGRHVIQTAFRPGKKER